MPKFQNSYSVQKIVYKQKCRCFCPIGKADYTNEFTVIIEPAGAPNGMIPDYCEIDKFIRESLEGESLVIEEAAYKLKQKIVEDVRPRRVTVESAVNDAVHGDVVVTV